MEEITNTGLLYGYPELSSRLLSTSSFYYNTYQHQSCDLPLSLNELKKTIRPRLRHQFVFNLYEYDFITTLRATEVINYYQDNAILINHVEASTSTAAFGVYGHVGRQAFIENIIDKINDDTFLTLDVKSIFHAYKARTSCQNNNYAILKTKEEFNHILNILQNNPVQLNLYIVKNAQLLGLINLVDVNKIYKKNIPYEEYVESTDMLRRTMIDRINNAINNFI
jgi:hypothetical protein